MATPYLQLFSGAVPSTQDLARSMFEHLPQVVIADGQTEGRGRSGSEWITADRALAVSLAWRIGSEDHRPFSLIAGVAASRAVDGEIQLKWPNDLMVDEKKVGGILVERSDDVGVAGMGLNLFWGDPPDYAAAIFQSDPGPDQHREIGALWAAEFMSLIDNTGWAMNQYVDLCSTIGRPIVWEPDGAGMAREISDDGGLVVETADGTIVLRSGAVTHVRDG